jgi:hypothetical protein
MISRPARSASLAQLLAIERPGKSFNADPYTFGFAALLILVFGPGRFSLDYLISRIVAERLR